jgi:hypothetical protein
LIVNIVCGCSRASLSRKLGLGRVSIGRAPSRIRNSLGRMFLARGSVGLAQ